MTIALLSDRHRCHGSHNNLSFDALLTLATFLIGTFVFLGSGGYFAAMLIWGLREAQGWGKRSSGHPVGAVGRVHGCRL